MRESLIWWAMWVNRSFYSNQTSNVSESLRSLTKNEQPWAIRSGRSEEMNDVSELLISLTKDEWMSESLIFWANRSFAHFLTKNEQFARKSNERIPSPGCRSWNWKDLAQAAEGIYFKPQKKVNKPCFFVFFFLLFDNSNQFREREEAIFSCGRAQFVSFYTSNLHKKGKFVIRTKTSVNLISFLL